MPNLLPLILVFFVLPALGGLFYAVHKRRVKMLTLELEDARATCIELSQTHEQQEFLAETVDYMTFSLLGMHDDDVERFNNHLMGGMQTVSVVGEVDAIRVFRNLPVAEPSYTLQLSWEPSGVLDGSDRIFSYASGWYEKLSAMHIINSSVADLEQGIFDRAKSVLVVPVYFQEDFWGMVWYEDFSCGEPFSLKRVSLLRSASLMIVSAVHRRKQATRIRVVTRSMKIMLDAMPIGCFIWKDKKILDANAAAIKFFNFKNLGEFKSRFDETSPGEEFFSRALSDGECSFEWTYRVPDTGELVPAEVNFIRMDYDGEHVVAGYIHDVRELTAALEEAKSASIAKSNFLSTMSHEIRTPINVIIGMTELGSRAEILENKDAAFGKISTASKHLLGIINDILDMSKIEAGMLGLSEEPFEFDRLIGDVIAVNQFLVEQKNQKFTFKIDSQIPKIIVSDSHRLAQVLTNLISNACKFTADGKEIELSAVLESATTEDCVLRFSVADEGIGLTQEQQANLFKSFVQAESDTARKYGGTGLGLSISKHIVEHMGGEIWVESEYEMGAKFSFTVKARLPSEEMLTRLADIEKIPLIAVKFPGRRLLLAEDVEVNREIMAAIFEDTEMEIVYAKDGAEAIQIFSASPEKFDIIFMDVHMPVVDGYEATRQIRALGTPHAQKIPIIAMTANVFREDIENCIESGMNAHLGKPVDFAAVKTVLSEYL